ncbi:MMPL family transporter [Streptomyces durmitorensis]|uniref:MMPL family transporter n=1 Tax=Streptomyces durmitorensis TaxID=319947 RepID=A0ABY4PQQ8_9ACTN|nr:MMPL family transporter [Streptomyces durmitorensis]UQT55730.1 MMPL family transporter [Streptomyces durmitorensis]
MPGIGKSSPDETVDGHRGTLVQRITAWSVRHRKVAIAGWFALIVVAIVVSGLVKGDEALTTDPGESGRAQDVLRSQQTDEPVQENVLIQPHEADSKSRFSSPEVQAAVNDLLKTLKGESESVSDISSPLDKGNENLLSEDGRSGLVTFKLNGPDEELGLHSETAYNAILDVQDRHEDVWVGEAGDMSTQAAVDNAYDDDFQRSEIISLPLTLVILIIVFGALIAASVPLLLSVTAVLAALGFLQALGHVIPINSTVSSVVLLIGMAVGIDYSLFYLRREREERQRGRDFKEALQVTARTSGHAVVISGITVMLCLSGLYLTGMDVFRGLAIGTTIVVGLTVIGSVTVLPALLSVLGHRVDKGRIPWLGRRRTAAAESKVWARIARAVVHRPLVWGGAALLALLVVAFPALDMRLQDPSVTDSLPNANATVETVARMDKAFPGDPSPARLVVWGDKADDPAVGQAVESLRERAAETDGQIGTKITSDKVGDVVVVKVPLAGSGTDDTSNAALETLREDLLPDTLGKVDGIEFAVNGQTAQPYDFTKTLRDTTPIVFTFVLAVAFILLLVSFRSLAVPIISIVLNLLSITAAYGAVTWVFQDGNLSSLLDFTAYGGVTSWLPLFMFVLLFGLSMDYHIFILSRIRERRLAGEDPNSAVISGISTSAGVVSSAAVIMVAVFSIFVTLSAIEYKMLGVGMSLAIIIDATLVRGVLLPAVMALLGKNTWALPQWLQWLPGGKAEAAASERTPAAEPTEPAIAVQRS